LYLEEFVFVQIHVLSHITFRVCLCFGASCVHTYNKHICCLVGMGRKMKILIFWDAVLLTAVDRA